MRLLKIRVEGVRLFKNGVFELSLLATDRVVNPSGLENPGSVHRIGSRGSLYSQNVTAVAGINASGKTTVLQVVRFVLGIISGPYIARGPASEMEIVPSKFEDRFAIEVAFEHEEKVFLLRTNMAKRHARSADGEEGLRGASFFSITDETLWRYRGIPAKKALEDFAAFRMGAQVVLQRNDVVADVPTVSAEQRVFLRDDMSIVSAYVGNTGLSTEVVEKALMRRGIPKEILHVFDCSIEYLRWDEDASVFHLKFYGEPERIVGERAIGTLVSSGTIVGSELVQRALIALREGSFLIVDEIEQSLNKSLVAVAISLFASAATNPHGAQLIFSTHYLEVLDSFKRKDNVYLTVRGDDHKTELVRYSDRITRVENKKSEVIFANLIGGTAPKYSDLASLRSYIAGELDG